jgi:hypothetical protein
LTIKVGLKYPLQNPVRQSIKASSIKALDMVSKDNPTIPKIANEASLVPLGNGKLHASIKDISSGQFARLFLLISADCIDLTRNILDQLNEINSTTLASKNEALSHYRLSHDERKDTELDILTGYQVFDHKYRIIMVEGIKTLGLHRLANSISMYVYLLTPPDSCPPISKR